MPSSEHATMDPALRRVIDAVETARAERVALDLRGGGTKGFYGEPPRGRPLELADLAGIVAYEPSELVVTVRAGTPLAALEAALAERGQCLPFEPPRFAPGGTVGGMVAAGLAGPARPSVGSVRDHVLGAAILNGRAQLLRFGGQVIKNVAGYDVARVFAGSWGILGVVLEVSLKVLAVAPASATQVLESDEADARRRLARWATRPWPLSASAWDAGRLVLRFSGARAAVDAAVADCGGEALAPEAAALWWEGLRDQRHPFFALDPAAAADGESLWRLSVPPTAPLTELGGARLVEWGGALLWWRGRRDPQAVRAAARAAGGHATLVRAVDKRGGAHHPLEPTILAMHRRLKAAFDPDRLFNRGRLVADL